MIKSQSGVRMAASEYGGLLIEAVRSSPPTAVARLLPEGAEVACQGCEPLLLPWAAFGEVRSPLIGAPRDGWAITEWTTRQLRVLINLPPRIVGLAIHVSGTHASRAEPIRAALPREFGERFLENSELTGFAIPIVRAERAWQSSAREREILPVLALVLKGRRDIRARLTDRDRVQRLAAELTKGPTKPASFNPVRRDATDISVAMRDAGLTHPFGRPLGDEQYRPLDELVDDVRARLERNPHRVHRTTDDSEIARLIRKHYLEVQPWPFTALTT